MTTTNLKSHGHSADIRIELRLNGQVLPIAQLGRDFIVLRNAVNHPPAEAEIALSIDGEESCWPVCLAEGVTMNQQKTRITRVIRAAAG